MDTPVYYKDRICLLGDSAHATTPHQAAGAGQCIEDAVVLARLIALVRTTRELPNAFAAYDAVRRPRAQKIVETSQEVGQLYTFTHPKYGSDLTAIVEDMRSRFNWIWEHDLEEDVKKADDLFKRASVTQV